MNTFPRSRTDEFAEWKADRSAWEKKNAAKPKVETASINQNAHTGTRDTFPMLEQRSDFREVQ